MSTFVGLQARISWLHRPVVGRQLGRWWELERAG